MKIKRVEVGGRIFRLAPLTLGQVERVLDADVPVRERLWHPILHSLENAGERPDLRTLETLLDYEQFCALQDAVLELSALRREKGDRVPSSSGDEPVDFSFIRARLAAHCGWTFAESDHSPFPEILALFEYWTQIPPVDQSFASWAGYKPSFQKTKDRGTDHNTDSTREEKASLVSLWGGRVIRGQDNLPLAMQAAFAKEGLLHYGNNNPGTPSSEREGGDSSLD